jgi:hypothetical protein
MSYVRLSDIEFATPEHRAACETLYKDILALEFQILNDEEMLEYFKSVMGDKVGNVIAGPTVMINKRILTAMKLTFWYYTNKSPSHVVGHEPKMDIFNP